MIENVHYRCVMDVEAAGDPLPTFADMVAEVVAWIRKKEGPGAVLPPSWVLRQGSWRKPDGKAMVDVDSVWPVGEAMAPTKWALRYRHQDTEFAARRWTIDIGIDGLSDRKWRVAITVGNSLTDNYLGQEPGKLPVTPPRLVATLLGSGRWRCTAGNQAFSRSPTIVPVGKANLLRNAIASQSRDCALVYVSVERSSGLPLVDASRLAASVAGSAVVYVAQSAELDEELEYLVPFELRAPNGMVRVYAPGAVLDDTRYAHRHRFFTRH